MQAVMVSRAHLPMPEARPPGITDLLNFCVSADLIFEGLSCCCCCCFYTAWLSWTPCHSCPQNSQPTPCHNHRNDTSQHSLIPVGTEYNPVEGPPVPELPGGVDDEEAVEVVESRLLKTHTLTAAILFFILLTGNALERSPEQTVQS